MPAHLFEIEDLPFVPAWFRNYGTDWIRFLSDRLDLYRPIAQLLAKQIRHAENRQLIDICSGSGGGWLSLMQHLDALGLHDVQVTLTDKHPNLTSDSHLAPRSKNRILYKQHPVDILSVPWKGNNLRTMMLALHHFSDAQAQEILRRAICAQAPVAIFDITGPRLLNRLTRVIGCVMIPLAVIPSIFVLLLILVGTPAVRSFRWTRILLIMAFLSFHTTSGGMQPFQYFAQKTWALYTGWPLRQIKTKRLRAMLEEQRALGHDRLHICQVAQLDHRLKHFKTIGARF